MGRAGAPPLSQCSEPGRAGSSRVQFFVRRARRRRYPPTTATPARPRTSSALAPVRDRLRPVFAACVGEALGALAPPVGCAMVPSVGRSISSGSMPGFDVAAAFRLGAGLALDVGRPDCVGTAVALGVTTDGARPVAPGAGAELGCGAGFSDGAALGCVLGACVGSAEGSAVGVCVGSVAGADDVSGAGAALGSGAEDGSGAGVGSALGAVVGSGAGALLGSGAALGSGAEDGVGGGVGSALGAADGVGDGAGLGSGCFWPHCSPSQFIVKLRYQMPP